MNIAIVGSSHLTPYEEILTAKECHKILSENKNVTLVSGASKGVDTIAEKTANELNIPTKIFTPKSWDWDGFKERNLKIAQNCDRIYSISTEEKTEKCYHCKKDGRDFKHQKTAGCWTLTQAIKRYKVIGKTIILK